jgi:3',5'-cyclic AMP phosphodiesterase CpdA
MPNIAWLTDLHLNFLQAELLQEFLDSLIETDPDLLLIGGDIGEARDVEGYLEQIADALKRPIYFVLGNHDFYHGSIHGVRTGVERLCERCEHLHYLSVGDAISLTPRIALVGHDGWADGRIGDYAGSDIMLNDYRLIDELAQMPKAARRTILEALGDDAADHFRRVLPPALERHEEVYLLTHVPPWREACWHEGQLSDDEWAPHFACQAVGDALTEIMDSAPDRRLTVLCGHTHSSGEAQIRPNLQALTGQAEYGHPTIQRVFVV